MRSDVKCKNCESLRGLKHSTRGKSLLCSACQTWTKKDREVRARKHKSNKSLAEYDRRERELKRQIKDKRDKGEHAAVAELQKQVQVIQVQQRNASKKIERYEFLICRSDFLLWRQNPKNQRCRFCDVTDADLQQLAANQNRHARLPPIVGFDRKDDSKPYASTNIVPCCDRCHKMRSKPFAFTFEHLLSVGPILEQLWRSQM